jgi:hypothetical protein
VLVDVVHVLKYIWKAALALFGESCSEAEEWVSYRLFALLTDSSGGELARTIRWWANKRKQFTDGPLCAGPAGRTAAELLPERSVAAVMSTSGCASRA